MRPFFGIIDRYGAGTSTTGNIVVVHRKKYINSFRKKKVGKSSMKYQNRLQTWFNVVQLYRLNEVKKN